MRRAIAGPPNTGKTTLAGPNARHTDDTIATTSSWDGAHKAVAAYFDDPSPTLTVEGVKVAHGLREWLREHPTGKPVDEVIRLVEPRETPTQFHRTLAKGEETVWRQIEPELRARGVRIVTRIEVDRG
jgi:hypothetical protein